MARDGHCAAYDAAAHRLVVFGGRGADRRRLNDVHHLDLSTWVWKRVITDGTGMLPWGGCVRPARLARNPGWCLAERRPFPGSERGSLPVPSCHHPSRKALVS